MISGERRRKLMAVLVRKINESFWFYSWGMSKRYRQSLRITVRGDEADVHLDYRGEDGEPLGVWFEYGTRRHFIEPKVRHPASGVRTGRQTDPIDPEAVDPPLNRRSRQAPQALTWLVAGKRYYSRGHYVRGITGRNVIQSVRNDLKLNLPALIRREIAAWR